MMEYVVAGIFWAGIVGLLYGACLVVMDKQHEYERRNKDEK